MHTEMVTTSTKMDLEFATVGIQVYKFMPQVVDIGIQVSLENKIFDDSTLIVSHQDVSQADCDTRTVESADG